MIWHEETLDRSAQAAAAVLVETLGDRFYLAGGTGLALQLGHRISLDLDLFSREEPLVGTARLSLVSELGRRSKIAIHENKDGTVHLTMGKTSVSLFAYPYRLLKKSLSWKGLAVASFEDIAAMKLSAVVGRGSRKDFIDLYFLSRKIGLDEALRAAAKKFSDHADFPLQALKSLSFFDDAEREPMPRMLDKTSWRTIRLFFEREVPHLTAKLLRL